MIQRLLTLLLALHLMLIASVASAAEPVSVQSVWQTPRLAMEHTEQKVGDTLSALCFALLKHEMETPDTHRYASEGFRPDHGLSLLEGGAAVNLAWRF